MPPEARGSVLVVEDHPENRRLLLHVLRKEGYPTTGAANGRSALRRLRSRPTPSLVLLDLRMPVMTGWELVRILRENPRWRALPVVAMTGDVVSRKDLRAFSGRLAKPVSLGRLLRTVRRFCR